MVKQMVALHGPTSQALTCSAKVQCSCFNSVGKGGTPSAALWFSEGLKRCLAAVLTSVLSWMVFKILCFNSGKPPLYFPKAVPPSWNLDYF